MSKQIDKELNYVLAQYAWQGLPHIIPGPSGMNNTTLMIQDEQKKAIIRIYNNHSDYSKLQFEHCMLKELQLAKLPVATPIPIGNIKHSTITLTPSGKLAAAFHYIEGNRPSVHHMGAMVSLAKAAALLSKALAQIDLKEQPAYLPYYELENNYPPFGKADLLELLSHEQLVDLEQELLLVQAERVALEQLKQQFQALPHQWIHGDLNCSNSLAMDHEVVALLDFEFVTRDLRAMELAVLLSEMINPSTAKLEVKLKSMLHAYTEIVPLCKDELLLLNSLIKLRSVDVVMHFVERFKQGLDSPDVLRSIVDHAAYVINGINQIKLING